MNANGLMLLASSAAEIDILRRFLAWAQSADAEARADGASALARAYLHSDLAPSARAEAVLAMTALLDDASVLVRRTLAEALCRASEASRTLIVALAADEPEVAAPVLQRSPVLTDADLVDRATNGDVRAQTAIAQRPNLPPAVAVALVEIGQLDAVLALIGNDQTDLPADLLGRIMTRFNDDTGVRDALLERPSLPASLRARIAVAAAKALAAEASQWMDASHAERVAREARDQAICAIASSCRPNEREDLTRALRAAGGLTPAVLLRSLLGGERDLFVDALTALSGLPTSRVAAFVLEPHGQGFAALAHKAGLKNGVLPAFRAALDAMKAHAGEPNGGLKLQLVQKVIDDCERLDNPMLTKVRALLWRFAAEAAKAEAASFAREAVASAPSGRLPPILDFSPVNDHEERALKLIADFSPATVEMRSPVLNPPMKLSEDRAPHVELAPKFVARLRNAA